MSFVASSVVGVAFVAAVAGTAAYEVNSAKQPATRAAAANSTSGYSGGTALGAGSSVGTIGSGGGSSRLRNL
jgi:hypothetical protein